MAPKLRRSTAGASTPHLPPSSDVVFEILSWLPARSLIRSRCVCKSWRALISDPTFLAVHTSRAEPLFVAASYSGRGKSSTTTLQIMDAEGHVARLVDIGGLWTLRASVDAIVVVTSRYNDNSPAIRVVDLAAGATIATIASFPRPTKAGLHVWFGFGRAAQSGALKVIRIVFGGDHHTCEVLTLGDDGAGSGWRQMGSPSPQAMSYDYNDGVALNGVLHFLSMARNDILCFDIEGEEWTTFHGPSRTPTTWETISLAELNGTLCITHGKGDMVDLWLRKKDVWVKPYTISYTVPLHIIQFVPLRVMQPGGKLLFFDRRDYMPRSAPVLLVYDPRSGKCTEVEKAPTNIVGGIGLCSPRLDSRLYG